MLLKRWLGGAVVATIAALATIASPGASAGALTVPASSDPTTIAPMIAMPAAMVPAKDSLSCPAWYNGPTNLATGCPYWLMS